MAAGFHFAVGIGDALSPSDGSFQEVSGIAAELEVATVAVGGENRFVHALPKGVKHPRLVLKRGVVPIPSPLVSWCRDVLESGRDHALTTKTLRVALLDEAGAPLRVWVFEDAFPVNWAIAPLLGTGNEVATEELTLSYKVSRRER